MSPSLRKATAGRHAEIAEKNTGVILQVLHNSGALAPLLARRSFAKEGG